MTILKYDSQIHEEVMKLLPTGTEVKKIEISTFILPTLDEELLNKLSEIGVKYLTPQ
jgi:hypothetical protein